MKPSAGHSQIKGSLRDRYADLNPEFVAQLRRAATLPDGMVHLKKPDGEEQSFPATTMREWLDGEPTPAADEFQAFLEAIFDA